MSCACDLGGIADFSLPEQDDDDDYQSKMMIIVRQCGKCIYDALDRGDNFLTELVYGGGCKFRNLTIFLK